MSIKKLLYKYKFLKCELEEIIEERDKFTQQLLSKLKREEQPVEKTILQEDVLFTPSENIKKLYKLLSKHLHPDKGGSELKFNQLQEEYKKENLIGLLSLAIEIDLDILEYIGEESIQNIEQHIQNIEKEIDFIQKSAPYVWGHLSEDKKSEFENWLIENHNFKKRKI